MGGFFRSALYTVKKFKCLITAKLALMKPLHRLTAVKLWKYTVSFTGSILVIYGPMISTALYVMLLMWANPLRGKVGGGWALEIETFLGPVKWHRAVRRMPCGAQNSQHVKQGPTLSHLPK
jgi:hypothetical protein